MRLPKLHPKQGRHQYRNAVLTLVFLFGLPGFLRAQASSLDVSYGAWYSDTLAYLWSAGITRPLFSPFDYGVSLTHLDDHRSPFNRTQTGGELSLGIGRDGSGPYALASAGLSMKHTDGNLDAAWSAGAGATARLLPFLSIGAEVRYRVEDQYSRGFGRRDATDRAGWMAAVRVSLVHGGRRRGGDVPLESPSRETVERAARSRGVESSTMAADVVGTALQVMGTPYRWGGYGANGYDCSGLIQFAYAEHGITLPRISRDQAAAGSSVDRDVDQLAPGDILGFSVEGDRVTHVGLYVGKGEFIHSASSGVKLSSLTAKDPDSLWWQRRWTVARRILR